MQKQAPSIGRIFVMVLFALSCFGILLYLWLVFGGSIPLKPQGYRVDVNFPEATKLAQEADVRISGVPVGRGEDEGARRGRRDRRRVEIEIDQQYAPIPEDTRAILRQKTLLGETYVELTPGTKDGPMIPDGGQLDAGAGRRRPSSSTRSSARSTRRRARRSGSGWTSRAARSTDRGEDINDALGNLRAVRRGHERRCSRSSNEHERATQQLVRDTGEVFARPDRAPGPAPQLIVNSNRVFETTAARDEELAETFRVLPTFLDESRVTHRPPRPTFANNTNPLVTQLRPAARELSPTLIDLAGLAPDLKALFRDLDPLITVSKKGLPALEDFLNETTPLLAPARPVPAQQLNPILDYLGLYKHEITAFFANDVGVDPGDEPPLGARRRRSTTCARRTRSTRRTSRPTRTGSRPTARTRTSSRSATAKLKTGLEVFGDYLCTTNAVPPDHRRSPACCCPQELLDLIQEFVYGGARERQRRAALQGAGAARAAAHRHARRVPACRSCARSARRLVT